MSGTENGGRSTPFTDTDEGVIGTDPNVACADGAGLPDWPPDFDDSQTANLLDLLPFKSHYKATEPSDPLYDPRYDLNLDEVIDLPDLLPLKLFINLSCTP
jgi:hypothetical protein